MKSIGLAAFGLTALVGTAYAQRVSPLTGGKLGNICISKDHGQVETCRAYLDGISDTISFYQVIRPSDGSKGGKLPDYVCVPKMTTGPQLQETYVAWLRAHKEAQQQSAAQAAIRAFNDSYPCPGEDKK